MSALDEVRRHLRGREDLAGIIVDTLAVGGYLVDPRRPLRVVVENRVATDMLEAGHVRTFWNGDALVGVEFPTGWRAEAA